MAAQLAATKKRFEELLAAYSQQQQQHADAVSEPTAVKGGQELLPLYQAYLDHLRWSYMVTDEQWQLLLFNLAVQVHNTLKAGNFRDYLQQLPEPVLEWLPPLLAMGPQVDLDSDSYSLAEMQDAAPLWDADRFLHFLQALPADALHHHATQVGLLGGACDTGNGWSWCDLARGRGVWPAVPANWPDKVAQATGNAPYAVLQAMQTAATS